MLFGKRSEILDLRHRSSPEYLHLMPDQGKPSGAQSARLPEQLARTFEHPNPTRSKRKGKVADLQTSYWTNVRKANGRLIDDRRSTRGNRFAAMKEPQIKNSWV
jgi:hypothetical protein